MYGQLRSIGVYHIYEAAILARAGPAATFVSPLKITPSIFSIYTYISPRENTVTRDIRRRLYVHMRKRITCTSILYIQLGLYIHIHPL